MLEFIQFHAQRNINRIDSFEKEILRGTMIAKFENVCCFPNNYFYIRKGKYVCLKSYVTFRYKINLFGEENFCR